MTPEAQRIAIAEACGLKFPYGINFSGRAAFDMHGSRAYCPDYLNDLNAMHEAVKALTPDQKNAYAIHLSGALWTPQHTRGWQDWRDTITVSEATAKQRADAFILAVGKSLD